MKIPKDINGVEVKIGDKVKGFGTIVFYPDWKVDLTGIATVNIQNDKLYYDKFIIIKKIIKNDIKIKQV